MTNITTKIAKNGVTMYYVDGKRIGRDKAIEISKNADNEMLTNALGANVELKDAQAILVIATKDPLKGGKDGEFGWCFTNVVDAVEAAKKVAALFGDRFIRAYIMGDAEHDNRIIATVDKAGNVKIKKQTPTYIFTDYQIIRGINPDGRTEHTETFATYCRELGDDDNFTGLYRAVTYYEEDDSSGWDIKTADGKLIAKGNTEAELKKAYEAIKAGNVEVSEEIAEVNDRRFLVSVHYDNNGANGMASKHFATAAEEIADATAEETAEINAADVKINVADNGKIIEQIKVDVDTAISIINRLNYRNDTFIYCNTTREDNTDIKYRHFDAYKDNGEKDSFAITEIVVDGKLETVRFFNLFRDITVDLQIDYDNAPNDEPPANQPDEDDISDICKYNPNVEDDDKPVLLDWDDSAIGMDDSDKIFADPAAYDAAIEAAFKAQYPDGKAILKPVIIDNGKTYSEGEYAAKVADADLVTRAENKNARDLTAEERDALFASWRAQTLSDPAIDAAYQKAKQIVKVDIRAGGSRWHVQKKNGEWTLNKPYAMKRLYECGITDTDFIIKAKHDVPSGDKIEGATAQSVEETAPEVNPDEYIITQEAMDEAVEDAELKALFAKWTAKILSDPGIEAAYRKAKERVEVEFTSYGAPLYTYIKKNGERCYDERVAKCYIGKCGLSETDFIVKARAEDTVCDLTAKLKDATRKADYMNVTTQSGEEFISRFGNVRVQPDGGGFIFTNGHETLARYDTKEQCEFVIDWIKKTVADGGNEFEFPTAELVALEMNAYELLLRYLKANYRYIGRHCWQMRIGDKWRNAPRRFMAADLKYYGLTLDDLRAYKTA